MTPLRPTFPGKGERARGDKGTRNDWSHRSAQPGKAGQPLPGVPERAMPQRGGTPAALVQNQFLFGASSLIAPVDLPLHRTADAAVNRTAGPADLDRSIARIAIQVL